MDIESIQIIIAFLVWMTTARYWSFAALDDDEYNKFAMWVAKGLTVRIMTTLFAISLGYQLNLFFRELEWTDLNNTFMIEIARWFGRMWSWFMLHDIGIFLIGCGLMLLKPSIRAYKRTVLTLMGYIPVKSTHSLFDDVLNLELIGYTFDTRNINGERCISLQDYTIVIDLTRRLNQLYDD